MIDVAAAQAWQLGKQMQADASSMRARMDKPMDKWAEDYAASVQCFSLRQESNDLCVQLDPQSISAFNAWREIPT